MAEQNAEFIFGNINNDTIYSYLDNSYNKIPIENLKIDMEKKIKDCNIENMKNIKLLINHHINSTHFDGSPHDFVAVKTEGNYTENCMVFLLAEYVVDSEKDTIFLCKILIMTYPL